MPNFKIKAIEEDFKAMFSLSETELSKMGAIKMTADKFPGFPCRVSLEDAQIGEEVILFTYRYHKTKSPYQASGPVYIRKNARKARLRKNEVPAFLNHRQLSLRGYNKTGMMIESATCDGYHTKGKLYELFNQPEISYIHIHNAGPGCYNCVAERI